MEGSVVIALADDSKARLDDNSRWGTNSNLVILLSGV